MPGNFKERAAMKNRFYAIIWGLLFYGISINGFGPKTFFGIRSQSVNRVRELISWQQEINRYDLQDSYGTFCATLEYSRSFRPDRINDVLFGGNKLKFSGSRVVDRGENDILADYFGLPPDFESTVCFTPRITNLVLDFNWHHAFECCVRGLYVQLHMPIVHTKWDLNFREGIIRGGTAFHPAGHMGAERVEAASLAKSVTEAFQGKTTFGDMREPLKFGKVFGRQNVNRVAEIHGTFGWRFMQDDWYHVGVFVRAGAPVGNAPNAEFIFEPIAGNRHHWELGGGLTSHVRVWENDDATKRVVLYFDAHISHLFSATQMRSYDLKNNGNGSRYMLISEITSPSVDLLFGGNPAPNQYVRRLLPAINKTTLKTKISVDVQADIVFKVAYQRDNVEFDFGYNFWGVSKEKIHCRDRFEENRFGLKGDAQVYGFVAQQPNLNDLAVGTPVALSATQSKATIRKGQGQGNANFANLNVDSPTQATTVASNLNQLNLQDSDELSIARAVVQSSSPPVLLKDCDINEKSALLPRAITHKIFTHFNYIWDNGDDFTPYLGGGLSGEWADTKNDKNIVPSQWAIWIKGGLSY